MATKADIDQWITSQGGPNAVAHSYDDVEVPDPRGSRSLPDGSENPDYDRAFKDKKITVRRETWTNPTTGATYSGTRTPFADDQFQDIKQGSATKPNTADPTTPAGRTAAATATEAETKAQEATREAAERKKNRELPANLDPRDETDAQRAARADARIKQQGIDARQATIDAREAETRAQNASTAAAASRRADSAESRAIAEANKVGSKVESVPRGGQDYTKITKTSPDGKTTAIEYYGPDGNQIAALPSEGAATTGGPKMPQIVVGASQDALRQYHEALWADPSLTPKQRETRFQEAVQTANIAVQESTAAETKRATQQREQESQRNTDYNVGVASAKFLQDGQQAAYKFASELKGTDLGGKVFAAMLGLNLATLEASNLNRLTSQGKPLPTITPADMRSTAAIDAKRAEIDQHIATVTPPNAIGAGAIGNTPPAGAVSPVGPTEEQARAAGVAAGPGPGANVRPILPVGPQVAPTTPPMIPGTPSVVGDTGAPPMVIPPQPPAPSMVPGTPSSVGDTGAPPVPTLPPVVTTESGQPGYVPENQVTAPIGQMAPPPDFAALSQFQAPPPPPMQQPAAGGGDMVALRLAEIAARPSWLQTEDDLRFAQQHGREQDFWATPGAAA